MTRPVAVWWVKRDARLADNACLSEVNRLGMDVLPLFCFEPSLLAADDTSDMHVHAQWQAVTGLRMALRTHGADLVVAHGEVVDKLAKLHARVPFTHLFCHEEVGNDITFRRDRAVAAWCREQGVEYREFPQSSVKRGGVNRDRLQRWWQSRIVDVPPLPVPLIRQADELRRLAATTTFPKLAAFTPIRQWQPVSEADAHATLADFLTRRGRWYRGGISSPNTAFTAGSRLSVHLAWGTITARQVWHAVARRLAELDLADPASVRWRQSLEAFVSRLHWRDHFTQRLESEPELEFQSVHPCYRDVPYANDERLHTAWREGRTGYPLVDAVMRCLNFRMRAMAVSFACHVLHLDWRLIHPHMAGVFRDYDPGIHLSQLQMQAGVVGWNAIRVYNPAKQLADWDADCRFVKRWLPELNPLPAVRIVNGDNLPGYPPPVVPFAERAKQMTDALYAIRKSAVAKAATAAVYLKHGSRKKEPTVRPKRAKKPAKPTTPSLFAGWDTDGSAG
ncbi:MAG: deoxyribodipyrimidine photo-lyase [Fimbriiglobus sp.]|nr:deoxyribodipyrimidine photo-lyase [Fimbriiglobus sp.]